MAGMAAKRFRAVLEPPGDELKWVVARVPFDVKTVWKTMVRLRVKLEVGGEVFRTSLFADSGRGGHFVLVNKAMQKAAGAGVGAMVDFAIAPDMEEREAVIPAELHPMNPLTNLIPSRLAKQSGGGGSAETRGEVGGGCGAGGAGLERRQRRNTGILRYAQNDAFL